MKPLLSPRLGAIILALATASALAGCSALKLGYNALPGVAYLWLDRYVDFTEAQVPQVRAQLAALHDWHRHEELPRLAALLARMQQLVVGEVTAQQACAIATQVQDRLAATGEHAAAQAAQVAASLEPGQLQHLQRKHRRNNEDFFDQWLAPPPAERQERRFDQMLKRLEDFYGRLDARQRDMLREAVASSGYDASRVLAQRQQRQQDLLQVLQQIRQADAAPAQAAELLRAYVQRLRDPPDPGYRAWRQALLERGCRSFASLHHSTTADQRARALRRLQAYQRDVRELMAPPS